MRCEQIAPYLPGFAGGELRADTHRVVVDHIATCDACRVAAGRHSNVLAALATMSEREIAPPPYLLDAILETTGDRAPRRIMPMLPIPAANDVAGFVSEHRDAIASAAGTALVAAGAAYALWRVVRGSRSAEQPA